jgi:hypothetical protein
LEESFPLVDWAGFVPHFRLPVTLSYNRTMTESPDVVHVTAIAYLHLRQTHLRQTDASGNSAGGIACGVISK